MSFNRFNHRYLGELRPRFRLQTPLSEERVFDLIKEELKKDKTVRGVVVKKYAILKMPIEDVHFWSPELQLRIDFDEFDPDPKHTLIKCLIGPKQSVWLLFTFTYGVVGFVTFFAGSFGLVQLLQGKSSWLIWFIPVGLIFLSTVWLVAHFGKKTARNQMLHLINFIYHLLEEEGGVKRM